MVALQHRINQNRDSVNDDEGINLVTCIPNLNSINSLVTIKNMSQTAKYNAAFRIGQEISNTLKTLKQNEFEESLSKIR